MHCYVEPSPAGGYFVRLRGEAAPLSRHDTEEEAQAAAAAYERGLQRRDNGEFVLLDDGSEVLVRAIRPEDKPLFAAGWSHLSDASVYKRFLTSRDALTVDELAFFTEIDHVDHEAIGALDPATGEGVGVARYVRDVQRPHVAEAAIVVVDAWQGRGLGGKLLRRLCVRAAENRIRVFTAALLATNEAMLALFARLGEVVVTRRDGPTIEIDVELPVELPTLEHTLREAAAGRVRKR
ncbi:MAG TPA: GNAT family N-acetyltransferase [Solirubrobacter sp.]|nr:GNAT family N-acetyltransferase [Solirubrobacter sp.]